MSLTGQRQAIADALSTVEGVTGYSKRPTGLVTGAAWPLIDVLERHGRGFQVTWHVIVILPEDEDKASDWFDANYEAVADAVGEVAVVEQVYPDGWRTPEGDIQVMRLILKEEG